MCVTVPSRQQKANETRSLRDITTNVAVLVVSLARSKVPIRGGSMFSMELNSKGPNDQKTLNEELIEGLVEVAQRNPQHAVELFGVSLGVAIRLAAMPDAQLDDLATTPVALWRPALTERLIRRLPERQAMPTPAHEVYRPVVERINRLVLATFVRYADDPVSAALVCDVADAGAVRA